jgi:hypothetical protein
MSTATARLTIGAVLGTVGSAANTVSTVLGGVTKSVSMLDQFLDDAIEKQQARSIVDMADFESSLAEEKAQEMAERQLQVLQFCKQSVRHGELYEANFNRISDLLAARHNKGKSAFTTLHAAE